MSEPRVVPCDTHGCPNPATVWISAEFCESPRCESCARVKINALHVAGKTVRTCGVVQPTTSVRSVA